MAQGSTREISLYFFVLLLLRNTELNVISNIIVPLSEDPFYEVHCDSDYYDESDASPGFLPRMMTPYITVIHCRAIIFWPSRFFRRCAIPNLLGLGIEKALKNIFPIIF